MIPVKKTTNPNNTNSSPWLLCPSKSIPGKFYYFNGATGDAVWTISDVDKSKKDTIYRITDKTHFYPEPINPPNDESRNTTNSFSSIKTVTLEFPNNTPKDINHGPLPAPTFGQAVFPKYVTDGHKPKVIWAYTPLYLPDQPMQQHRETMDRKTQTYESNPFQNVKRTLNVNEFKFNQTLTNNVKEPIFTFGQTPTSQIFNEKPLFGQTLAFNPFKTSSTPMFVPKQTEAFETFAPIQRRVKTQSESDSAPKSALKACRSVENLTSLLTKDVKSSTVSPDDMKADKLSLLSKNDLRFLLVAKKKKVVSDELTKSTDQSIKTQESVTPKKRVTFDLQQPTDPNSEDSVEIHQSFNSLQIDNPSMSEDLLWYVATDTSVILSQKHSIEQFVKKDPFCRLLIPYAVYKDVAALSRGDCGVMSARQLLRRLGFATPHIVVQSKPEYEHSSPEDNILQCCWDFMKDNCRVILITDNKTIMNKAKSINLECHTLEEITTMKDNRKPTHTPTEHLNEIRNMKIIVCNDKKKSENLFLQDFSEINNFPFSKSNGYSVKIDRPKSNIFSAESKDSNVFSQKDSNSDKLINLTRPKNLNAKTCDTTNVNDKILNLSIADNSAANNRTKQVLQNVLRNTEVKKINQDNNFVFDHKNKSNQNLSEKNKVNIVNKNNCEISNETNLHIMKLKVTENNPVKDNIKVSGITKLNTHFNLDDELKRFYVKNIIVENRIKSRLDEWICRLNQTMEGVLTHVLLNEKVKVKKMMPPWNLFEAMQLTGEAFKKQHNIKTIVDQFSAYHLRCTSNNEIVIKNMKPNYLIKLIGYSMILLQNLKEIVNYKELYEAHDMMSDLIKNIEDPNTDIDFTLEKVNTPIFSTSEIPESKIPIPFRKNDADVIGYLKKHFEVWKSYEIDSPKETNVDIVETTTVNDKEPNVVRTFGRNLKMLKINNSKTITLEETGKVNIKPKVIRNVTPIVAFEEKLKRKQELDMNKLDYDESLYTITDASDDEDHNIGAAEIYKTTDQKSNDLSDNNIEHLDSFSSELDSECVQAYPLVKIFLLKLKRTLVQIYCFINDSMKEYQKGMTLEKKKEVKLKTEMGHGYLLKITERLKNIIARESGNATTLKDLLIKAGDHVENDKVISNYRNVIAQYLEQAEILEEALSILLSLSKADKKEREGNTGTFMTSSPIENKRVLKSNQMVLLPKKYNLN